MALKKNSAKHVTFGINSIIKAVPLKLKKIQDLLYSNIVRNEQDRTLESLIIPGGRLDNGDALEIHQKGYFARLSEALGEKYEAVWYVLGDEDFFSICEQYIKTHPSLTYNLTLYGLSFAEFLKTHSCIEEFPFLPQLADFECAFSYIFHAPCEHALGPLTLHKLMTKDISLKFKVTKSVMLKHYNYPIYEIWKACKQQRFSGELLERCEEQLCIHKKNEKVFVQAVRYEELALLKRICSGVSLEELLQSETFLSLDEDSVKQFFLWLSSSALIVGVL